MSNVGDRPLDVFGRGGARKFYMRDFKNAGRFKPGVDPVRHKFQGYVNFILNRDLFATLYGDPSGTNEFRTTISSLVRTAQMPGVQFQTETLNEYNRKKIVNTGVEYDPVSMTVFDTVGNEWLTLLMKYFSYHYMDPRNKNDPGNRDVEGFVDRTGGSENQQTRFGQDTFDSNAAGYNTNQTAHFFERIDYVLYHGNKGVQYSLINPVLKSFRPGEIDYSSSDFKDFELQFEYERFTIYNKVNFGLSKEDLDRFENVADFKGPAFAEADLPLAMHGVTANDTAGSELQILGDAYSTRNRSGQPTIDTPPPGIGSGITATYQDAYITSTGSGSGNNRNFDEDLALDTADAALRTTANQRSIGDTGFNPNFGLDTVIAESGTQVGEAINSTIGPDSPNQGQLGGGEF